jgi:hypothetical protein
MRRFSHSTPSKATKLYCPPVIKHRTKKRRKHDIVEVGLLPCENMSERHLALNVYVEYEIDILLFFSTLAW